MAVRQAPKIIKAVVKRKKTTKKPPTAKFDAYATMIADPCNAVLVPGMYGSDAGMLARFKSTYAFSAYNASWAAQPFGYVLWFPSYHNPTTTSGPANFFMFAAATSGTSPTLLNYGVFGAGATTASSVTDPAYNFVNGDTAQDARTLSACLTTSYIGTTSNAKGLFIPLTNVPLTAVLQGGTVNAPPTFDQLRNYATMQERAATTNEVIWRPSVNTPFTDDGLSGITVTNAANAVTNISAEVTPPMGIGFVLYGVSAMSDYTISAYKNIEWRAEPASGLTIQPPRGVDNPARISAALTKLDKKRPNWQTQAMHTAGTILTDVVLAGMAML